jgi:hypothetical protein
MKNSEKADAFFKVATEILILEWCEGTLHPHQNEFVVVAKNSTNFSSPYICDCLYHVAGSYKNENILKEEMRLFGMTSFGMNTWKHIEPERRQEARWFFLMFMTEYLDNE